MSDTFTSGPPEPAHRFRASRQKVAPFARYKGTSAWQKNRRRAREYARFRAAANSINKNPVVPND